MLIEFSVGNYKSFRDRVTLSMVAAAIKSKDKSVDEANIINASTGLKLLTSAAIYGANASGKSNLMSALSFMNSFVESSAKDTQIAEKIPVDRFRLSTACDDQPSYFEIVFLMEGKRYRYGFQANTDRIISEWLYFVPKSREATLFERNLNDIRVGPYFREGKGIAQRTRENALFLSVAAQLNGEISGKVLQWFKCFAVMFQTPSTLPRFILEESSFKKPILDFVNALDIDIKDFALDQEAQNFESLLPKGLKREFKKMGIDGVQLGKFSHDPIRTKHMKYDKDGQLVDHVEFLLDKDESHGTQRLFGLAPFIIMALDLGCIVAIDELETKLHPIITLSILNLFNNKQTNPKNAQIIFTTHDTNLLNRNHLRRDQIWFTEKDKHAATHLYSLAEFKVRNDASFDGDYIHGKYGAIPFIGNLEYLFGKKGD
jgi:uncharacterized protein